MTTEKPAPPEAPPNYPLAKVVCERGKFYVCKRKQYWDSEAKKSAEERSYIGRIVDGVYYSMLDYRRLFKRDGTLRAVERPKNRPYHRKTQPNKTAVADASKTAESATPAASAPKAVSKASPETKTGQYPLKTRRCVRLPATGCPPRTMPPTCSSPGRPTTRILSLDPSAGRKPPSFSSHLSSARAGRSHSSAHVWPECPQMRSTPTTRRTLRQRHVKFPTVSTTNPRMAAIVSRSA